MCGRNRDFNPKPLILSGLELLKTVREKDGVIRWSKVGRWKNGKLNIKQIPWSNADIGDHPIKPVLKLAVANYSPWVMTNEAHEGGECKGNSRPCSKYPNSSASESHTICVYGAAIELLSLIEEKLGIKLELYYVRDGKFGGYNRKTGEWNGMMRDLLERKADMGLGLTIVEKRSKVIDFSEPSFRVGLYMLTRSHLAHTHSGAHVENVMSFLGPFHRDVWIALIAAANIFIFVFWLTEKLSPHGRTAKASSQTDASFRFFDVILYVWGIVFGRDVGVEARPQSFSARVMTTLFSMVALMTVAAYSANLAAYLIKTNDWVPVNGLDDPRVCICGVSSFNQSVIQFSKN